MPHDNTFTDYQKVKDVFIAALDVAPEIRAAFLDESCACEDVRREVESLLRVRDEAGKFLEDVSAVQIVQDSIDKIDRFVGQTIDKYTVNREIGRGGMGAVYLATRSAGDFQKRVAIKIIKRGADTGETLKRFAQERRILAALEHPNIARLIDGGTTPDGVPYLMMEYVEGSPIDEFCARRDISIDEKLRLFQKICAAVAYAHRNLTIHRDLKSSNILVTADGEPKLLDFGIAKLFSSEDASNESETLTNFRALTPEYASPEQMRGEKLTTATDIYSLGVILYELLTGTRPFATNGKNFAEVLRIVSEIQPTRPSSVTGKSAQTIEQRKINGGRRTNLINGDVDNIVLKSLNKEPERRYGSVEQFCEDIEKYLKGLPVSARKDSFSYRFSKFVRRNPLASLVSTMLVLSLLAGFAVTFWQYRKAEAAQARAERRFNDVRGLSNSMLFELNDTIEKGPTAARAMIVERASEYLDKLNRESVGDASLQMDLAAAYVKVGDLQGRPFAPNLGDMNAALESYRKAADLIETLARLDAANPILIGKSADVRQRVGEIHTVRMNRVEALRSFTEVMRLREKVLSIEPQNQDFRREEADAEMRMGDVLQIGGGEETAIVDYPAVLERYGRALAVFEDLANRQPTYFSKERFTAASVEQRAGLALARFARQSKDAGKQRESIDRYVRVLSVIEKFAAAEPSNLTYRRIIAGVRGSIAEVQTDLGDYPAALDNYRQIESAAESAAAADAANVEPRINLASLYVSYGGTLGKSGDAARAVEKIRRGIKISESLIPEAGETRAADVYTSLIDGYAALGAEAEKVKNAEDSSAFYRKSLEYCDKLLSIDALHEETLEKKSLLLAKIK